MDAASSSETSVTSQKAEFFITAAFNTFWLSVLRKGQGARGVGSDRLCRLVALRLFVGLVGEA
jgi:hypothetical protein